MVRAFAGDSTMTSRRPLSLPATCLPFLLFLCPFLSRFRPVPAHRVTRSR